MTRVSREDRTLRAWLEAGPPTLAERLQLFATLGDALVEHRARTQTFRYLNPVSVRVDEAGEVSLVGAKIEALEPEAPDAARRTLDDSSLDSDPHILITDAIEGGLAIDYAPPELAVGLPYDERSEQFCLCVMLFEAVHGVRPFAAREPEASTKTWTQPAQFPRRSPVPRRVDELLRRGLTIPPSERWPSLQALVDELRDAAEELRDTPRRPPWSITAVAVVALVVVALAAALALDLL